MITDVGNSERLNGTEWEFSPMNSVYSVRKWSVLRLLGLWLLEAAKIRAASSHRMGPGILSLNHNETEFQNEENQRWAKESLLDFYS